MKKRYKLILLLFLAFPLGFTACSDDDDEQDNVPLVETPELVLEKSTIDIEVGKSGVVAIKEGGGEYSVFSSNPDIVSVELKDNSVTMSALVLGKTSIILSDKNGRYRELGVVAYYKEILLGRDKVEVKIPLGHTEKSTRIAITQGNEGYEISTESENITASIEDNHIVIKATQAGDAILKLTDSYGLELTVPVTVTENSTVAYDEYDLAEIKANTDNRYLYNNINIGHSAYSHVHSTTDGVNLYGIDYRNETYYYKVYFEGDKSVGVKTGGLLRVKYHSPRITFEESCDLEVIKNDGTKIWVVYSYIKDEKLNFGHFCQDVNPE